MTYQPDYRPEEATPNAALRQLGKQFKGVGWVSFWAQLVLAVVAGVMFIAALPFAGQANPASGGSTLFALLGLGVLAYSIYRCLGYVKIGRQLTEANPSFRPKKPDTLKYLWMSLITSCAGLLLVILAAEALTGALLGKAVSAPLALFSPDALGKLIQPLDIALVLANTHLVAAHFIGIVTGLWLLYRADR
jgi:Protein of unknown function (DUF3611)